jgi:2-oxoglutarate dehydrogenase E1 component
MWEAQFGDFANGAQVIIDQFIVSSEDKWNRLNGPGAAAPARLRGPGPRALERSPRAVPQLCAEDNIQVVQPTTTAQMFHLLRRQVLRPWRKPLVVMTPKSLLRLPAAASPLEDLATGRFFHVIGDAAASDPKAAKAIDRVLLCSGKIYYELVEERRKRGDAKVAIVRLEQLYPWWPELVDAALRPFAGARSVLWVQDEPANMGAATFVEPRLAAVLRGLPTPPTLGVVARAESASPATGSHKAHGMEQERIFAAAFTR